MSTSSKIALEGFVGRWTIQRQIEDRLSNQPGQFEGQADFQVSDGGLLYHEEGWLTLATAAPMFASRDYRWRAGGGRIAVDYADGRPFHDFDPDEGAAFHACDPDSYRVTYDFSGWPQAWQSEWVVTGPRKDYVMTTHFLRAMEG
ncbi:MAG: DUF6314 family protein [Paracoccaceae bacterium]